MHQYTPTTSPATERPTLCIVNYNGAQHLPASVGAAYALRDRFAAVLLIDNGSDDEGLIQVRACFPAIRIIPLARNYGPATARNVGFRLARSQRILFIDNDVTLTDGCVEQLMRALDDQEQAAVAMPRVVYNHDQHCIQYEGADSHFLGLLTLHSADTPLSCGQNQVRAMNSLVTACFLVDRGRWGAGPPFDERFFFNYEDHDFGLHTRTLGHQILAVPQALVYHGGGTPGLSFRPGGTYAWLRVFCLIRNRWLVILKHYQLRTLLLLAPMLMLYELCQLALVIRKGWLGTWLRAFSWMIAHLPETLRQRRRIQQARTTPDRAILSAGPLPFRPELATSRAERWGQRLLGQAATYYWAAVVRLL